MSNNNLRDFIGNAFQLTAGAAIAQNALVEIAADGKAYQCACSDMAAVANLGQIVAPTQLTSNVNANLNSNARIGSCQAADGSIYMTIPGAAGNGLSVAHYSPAGALINSVVLSASSDAAVREDLYALANGNVACVYHIVNEGVYYALMTSQLSIVTNVLVASLASNSFAALSDSAKMSNDSVVIVYNDSSANIHGVIYNNAGSLAVSATSLRSGLSGSTQIVSCIQLSNTDIALVYGRGDTTPGACFVASYSAAALAPLVGSVALANQTQVIDGAICVAVVTGYIGVAYHTGSNTWKFAVLDNALSLQGAQGSLAAGTSGKTAVKLISDGTANFYLSNTVTSSLYKIPITGSAITATIAVPGTWPVSNGDAFYENGFIFFLNDGGAGAAPVAYAVYSIAAAAWVTPKTTVGTTPTTSSEGASAISLGDFGVLIAYEYITPAGTNFWVGKYIDSAIIGVARAAASTGNPVTVAQGTNIYTMLPLRGSPSKPFDHSATNLVGNTGAMLASNALLKGM